MPSLSDLKNKKALGAVVPIDEILTREDFEKAINLIVEAVKSTRQELTSATTQAQKDNAKKLDEALKTLETAKEELGKKTDLTAKEIKEMSESDRRTTMRMLEQRFADVLAALPEEYNDAEMRESIQKLRAEFDSLEIPEQFDASEIMEEIDTLQKELDRIKKLPRGTVGGAVTDKHIQQAATRIVKQETPSGTIDGANTDFTVEGTIHAVLSFELNSRVVSLGTYSITGKYRKTISFDSAPAASYSGKSFVITYI